VPLRSSDDGTHEVTIGLEPEGLGTVKATVTVSAGQVVVQLGTDNDAARDALRQSLPLLRHELGGDGSSANVFLSGEGAQNGRAFSDHLTGDPGRPGAGDPEDTDATSVTPVPAAARRPGAIDLRL
jgi:flagellar hook-length control protein FliK